MDPRHQSPIEKAMKRYIKLLTLKSNRSIRSEEAKHLLGELHQCLYRYLGVMLPEKIGEVVPLQSLPELAAKKVHDREEFENTLRDVGMLMRNLRLQNEDEQVEKIKKRVGNMLRGYKKLTKPLKVGLNTDNIFEI